MDVLISDNACAAMTQKVKDILHMCHIKSCTSEPHHQHQNYAEQPTKISFSFLKLVTNQQENLWPFPALMNN